MLTHQTSGGAGGAGASELEGLGPHPHPQISYVYWRATDGTFIISFSLFQCVVCCQARSVMQVSPCGHQALCRLCFVHNIREAVASRDLPLKCLLCGSKIIRVKNNSRGGQDHPVHVGIGSRVKPMPKSVSGYSLCATTDPGGDQDIRGMPTSIAQSQSSYSMSSGKINFRSFLTQIVSYKDA